MDHVFESHQMPADARSVLISRNPKSGSSNRRQLVIQLADRLTSCGFDVQTIDDIKQLCDIARHLSATGKLRTVVSAGGDGTASMLVNELPPETPITVFPLGTANLLAKYLDANTDAARMAKIIEGGRTVRLDVGKANGRLFLVVASCGFDADVVERIHTSRRGHITHWSYGIPIVQSIWKYRFPKMQMIADSTPLDSARWLFVFNVPHYAMDLRIIADANAQDGQLDLCTFRDGGFINGLLYFFSVLFRRHEKISGARFCRFKELTIESEEQVPIELDGDPAGHLPVTISVVSGRFLALVSDDWQPTAARPVA